MIVLGIETATIACGVALAGPGGALGALQVATAQTHSQRLLPLIDALLRETGIAKRELGGIAVSQGPGSFTGLRIGVATAKALAFALGLPLVGVPTLAALAANAGPAAELVWPVLVAKRDEVYGAVYRRHCAAADEPLTLVGEPWAGPPAEFLATAAAVSANALPLPTPAWLCGDALARFAAIGDAATEAAGETALSVAVKRPLLRLPASAALPQAAVIAALGRRALLADAGVGVGAEALAAAESLAPVYVRRPQAELVWDAREAETRQGGAMSSER